MDSEPVYLVVGKLRKPHGLHGDLTMEVYTDFPERLQTGVLVYLGEEYRPIRIQRRRVHGNSLLLGFDEFQTPEETSSLRNWLVFVRADDRPPLPEGEYYHHQLLGLSTITDQGEILGELVQILETSANDVYIVRPKDGKDILLPAIQDVVLKIDLQARQMTVHLLPGLIAD